METLGSPLVDSTSLPDFAAWLAANPGLTLDRYAYSNIKLDHFFAVSSLLLPTLVRYNGGVFLEPISVAQFERWFAQTSSLTAVERVMNHRHVRDMIQSFDSAPRELLLSVAMVLQQCWQVRLKQLCPEVSTRVDVRETEFDVEITFYTIRSD